MIGDSKGVAIAVLGVLAVAWLALMWFFNLFSGFWWSILSVAVAIPLLLWASARSRTSEADEDSQADEE